MIAKSPFPYLAASLHEEGQAVEERRYKTRGLKEKQQIFGGLSFFDPSVAFLH